MKQPTEDPGSAPAHAQIQLIKVAAIRPDPNNRKDFDPAEITALAESIKVEGLLNPIILRRVGGLDLAPAIRRRKRRNRKLPGSIRSRDVLKHVNAGHTGPEIAKLVKISLPSVQNIKKQLGLVKANAAKRKARK